MIVCRQRYFKSLSLFHIFDRLSPKVFQKFVIISYIWSSVAKGISKICHYFIYLIVCRQRYFKCLSLFHIFDRLSPKVFQMFVIISYIWSSVAKGISNVCHYFIYLIVRRQRYFKSLSLFHIFDRLSPKVFQKFVIISYIWSSVAKGISKVCHYFIYLVVSLQRYFKSFSLFHIFDRLSPKVFQKFVIIWYIWSFVDKGISKVCHYFIYLIVSRQWYFKSLSLFDIFDRLSTKVFQKFVIISYIWSSVAKGNLKVCHYFIYLIVCRQRYLKSFHYFICLIVCHQRYFKSLSLFDIFDRLSPKVFQKFVIISYIWSSVAKGISKVCHYFIYLIVCRQRYFKSLSLFHIFDRLSPKVFQKFVIISYIWSSLAKGISKVFHYFIYLIACRQRYFKSLSLFHIFDRLSTKVFQKFVIISYIWSSVTKGISKVCHYLIYLIVCRQKYFKSLSLFHIFDRLSPKVIQKFVIISYIWSSVAKGISKVCHYFIYLIVCRQRYFKSLSLFDIFDRLSTKVFQKFVIISYIWSSLAKGISKVCHYFIYLIFCRQRYSKSVIISFIWSSVAKGISKVCHYFIYLIVCRQSYFKGLSLFHIFDRLSPKVFQKFVIISYIWSSVAKGNLKVCHYFIYWIVCRQRYLKSLSLFHIFDRLSPKVFQKFVIISYIWSSVAKGISKVFHYFIYLIACRQRYFKSLSLFDIFDRLSTKVFQKFVIISYIWSSLAKGISKVCHYFIYLIFCRQRYFKSLSLFDIFDRLSPKVFQKFVIISFIWSSVAKGISKVCHYFIYLIFCRQSYFKGLSLFHIFDRLSPKVFQKFVIIWYIWSSVAKGISKVCHYFIYLIVSRQWYFKSLSLFHIFDRLSPKVTQKFVIISYIWSDVAKSISKVCHCFIYLIVCRQMYLKSLSLFHIFDFLSPKLFQRFVIISYIWSSVAKDISKVCHYLIYLIVCRQRYFKSLSLFYIFDRLSPNFKSLSLFLIFDRLSPKVIQKFVIISYIWSSVAKCSSKVCHYFIYLIVCRQRYFKSLSLFHIFDRLSPKVI